MPPFQHGNLPLLLLQARERVLARFRPILSAEGLTEQQWRVLRALVERGPMEPREIVRECRISSPSLAGVLARMENLGLVERERFDNDQRRVRVSASKRSQTMAARMSPRIEDTYAELEDCLGPAFTQGLYATLTELIQRLDEDSAAADEISGY